MTLERVEQQLRRGDVDAVLLFADHERAIAEASRLLAADAATRTEFNNNERVLGSYLASVAAPHVARARRRAELGAEADIERRAAVARLAAGDTAEWGDAAAVGKALGLGSEFASNPRGRAALRRAGVRTRRENGHDEWNLGDVLATKERVGATGLMRDAGAGRVEGWC